MNARKRKPSRLTGLSKSELRTLEKRVRHLESLVVTNTPNVIAALVDEKLASALAIQAEMMLRQLRREVLSRMSEVLR